MDTHKQNQSITTLEKMWPITLGKDVTNIILGYLLDMECYEKKCQQMILFHNEFYDKLSSGFPFKIADTFEDPFPLLGTHYLLNIIVVPEQIGVYHVIYFKKRMKNWFQQFSY